MKRNIVVMMLVILVLGMFSCKKIDTSIKEENTAVSTQDTKNLTYDIAEGVEMPNIIVETNKGEIFNLEESTKPVLINFWATWCPPCRSEMPGLQELYEEYGNRVNFVMINVGENKEVIQNFLIENEFYTFPIGYDTKGELSDKFSIDMIPITYIIGKDKIVKNNIIGARPKEQFKEYLENVIK